MDKNTNKIEQLESRLKKLEESYAIHQHNNIDGTNMLRKNIMLDADQFLGIGQTQQLGARRINGVSDAYAYAISTGEDDLTSGFTYKSKNIQLEFQHYPLDASNQSFIRGFRKPLVQPLPGTSISVTSAGNTVTISGFNFVVNELAGAIINIYSSAGALIETRTIASNTSTVVTITGTWGATTSNGSFLICQPVFFGSAEAPWQRLYTMEGTGAGIRFGVGATAGAQNQNGLLYMDATGDIYWRNKSGTSTKLN